MNMYKWMIILPFIVACHEGGIKSESQSPGQTIAQAPDISERSASPPPELADAGLIGNAIVSHFNGRSETNKQVQQSNPKKIIKNGNFTIRTEDIKASKRQFDELLAQYGAYYSNESLSHDNTTIRYHLVVRVPAEKFEQLVKGIESKSYEIVDHNIYSDDVTEEYYDIETRLATKRDYLNRYRQLLSRANSIKDILEVEENIRVIQEEIESSEGRLRFLNSQVQLSTLNIQIFENKPYQYKPAKEDSFFERVKFALGSGWKGIVNFIIWFLAQWPFWISLGLILPIIRKWIKKSRNSSKD